MPTLEFTLMAGCPINCTVCPQELLRASYGGATKYMTEDAFRVILEKVPRYVRIDFAGFAEPWANPNATAMLRHALEDDRTIAVYTTLIGMEEDGHEVLELLAGRAQQVEVLCLHLPDAAGNMRGWKHNPVYEANLRRFVEAARQGLFPRFEAMTMETGGRLHPDLAHLGYQIGSWQGHSRAGNVEPHEAITKTPLHDAAVMCSFTPFYDQNVVMPNGDVYLCCMDYGLKHPIGNLLAQEYEALFRGREISFLRADNMIPGYNHTLCKSCDRARPLRQTNGKQFWQ